MADSEQYYVSLSDEHKRIYFPGRYYTEKIATLEKHIIQLENRLSGKGSVDAAPNEDLTAAQQKIAALEARISELEQKETSADGAAEESKEEVKQTARKVKGRKKDAADSGGDTEGA